MIFAIPEQQCPFCGYTIDRSSDADCKPTLRPNPGDVSVCFLCTEVSFFDAELRLRPPLPIELANLQRTPEWKQVERIRAAKKAFDEAE